MTTHTGNNLGLYFKVQEQLETTITYAITAAQKYPELKKNVLDEFHAHRSVNFIKIYSVLLFRKILLDQSTNISMS